MNNGIQARMSILRTEQCSILSVTGYLNLLKNESCSQVSPDYFQLHST